MATTTIDDMLDRTDWISACVSLQSADEDVTACDLFARVRLLQQRIDARARETVTPFQALAMRFGLSDTEQQIVMLLVAMRGPTRAQLQQTAGAAELSLDAVRTMIFGTLPSLGALHELSPAGTLRRFSLIERNDEYGPQAHESKHTWAIAPRVLSYLHGGDGLDPALQRIVRLGEPKCMLADVAVSAECRELARSAMGGSAVVVASGMPGLGRRTLLSAAAREAKHRVLEIDGRRLAKEPAALAIQLRAISRECRLLAAIPLLANLDALVDDSDKDDRIDLVGAGLAELVEGPVLVTTGVQRPRLDWERPTIVVELRQPTFAERSVLWRRALDELGDADIDHLATNYPLAPALIARAADAARARANGRALAAADIHAGIRAVLDDRLGQFAKRVEVTQSWEDLVLPQDQLDAVIELMARIRERRRVYEDWGFAAKVGKGLGTATLFSGPPGTGKTMVAALIARDLGLELYQVDLGKVVSKYIGETERNLAALFDAAEAGHAVLLFDEADALFGKRTDVKSSNDRYANLETNYLLQRLECFTGICILTSNHETNIDAAFMRRLSLHLRFELPDVEERAHLWRAMIPKSAPVEPGLGIDTLARKYAMSGGYIRNAALRAAFLAANDDSPITLAYLERAARAEYEGMGKIVGAP